MSIFNKIYRLVFSFFIYLSFRMNRSREYDNDAEYDYDKHLIGIKMDR